MPRYTIDRNESGNYDLRRNGDYLLWLGRDLSDTEHAAILRGLNGPSEATAKRVAELRAMVIAWREMAAEPNLNETLRKLWNICARDLESQANYLESR